MDTMEARRERGGGKGGVGFVEGDELFSFFSFF